MEKQRSVSGAVGSLNSTNYRDLQTYFFKEIEKHLNTKENPAIAEK
jgi:hypothetical protein